MTKFKEGDKVKVLLFNPFTFDNGRWTDAVIASFMEGFTKLKNDGNEYYALDIEGLMPNNELVHFFGGTNSMYREGEELPNVNDVIEIFKNEISENK
jgi:hypothetical protein